jgi:hypothetical protein
VLDQRSHVVHLRYQTRDIFEVVFQVVETGEPVLLLGDFNDEPFDIAVVDHLQASSELDRLIGPTNEIKAFQKNRRLPRRRHIPLQRLVALPRPREPRQLLHHLHPRWRGLPEPLPSIRPDHLHPRPPQANRAAPRPNQHRHPPHTGSRSFRAASTIRPQHHERHLRPPTCRRESRLLTRAEVRSRAGVVRNMKLAGWLVGTA